jgi:hypothetical protein
MLTNRDIIEYERFMEEERQNEKRRKELEDEGRDLLFPNADDEEYEEELMDRCFKEM